MSEAKHTPGPLFVVNTSSRYQRNFRIENNTHGLDGEWDDIYVSFSGYFGSYGPELFAAAPEVLEALKEILALTDDPANDADPEESAFSNARAVIAKAEGRSDATSDGRE